MPSQRKGKPGFANECKTRSTARLPCMMLLCEPPNDGLRSGFTMMQRSPVRRYTLQARAFTSDPAPEAPRQRVPRDALRGGEEKGEHHLPEQDLTSPAMELSGSPSTLGNSSAPFPSLLGGASGRDCGFDRTNGRWSSPLFGQHWTSTACQSTFLPPVTVKLGHHRATVSH